MVGWWSNFAVIGNSRSIAVNLTQHTFAFPVDRYLYAIFRLLTVCCSTIFLHSFQSILPLSVLMSIYKTELSLSLLTSLSKNNSLWCVVEYGVSNGSHVSNVKSEYCLIS